MVAHLVHADARGNKAVIAVLLKQGNSNSFVKQAFAHLPQVKGKEESSDTTIDVSQLLPASHAYYTFPGSLTTPPCSEGVKWFVLRNAVPVSSGEVAEFTKLYPHNARPVQPLNGRTILASE
jgi:carbonic anhydrase